MYTFKKLLSEIQWQQCVMLILAPIHHWLLALMMDYSHTHNAAPSAYTWVCHFPNPTYIKRHNLLSLLSLHAPPPLPFSQAMMRYGETERIRLPGNWKGARAARDVRLLWFITHNLMRIACVRLTRCVRGSSLQGAVGWKVVIDWAIPADKTRAQRGGGLCSGVCLCLIIMEGTGRQCLCVKKLTSLCFITLNTVGTRLKLAPRISFGLQGNYCNCL